MKVKIKFQKKFIFLIATIILILFGVVNTQGEKKIKDNVVEIKKACDQIGYNYISDVFVEDYKICISCIKIESYSKKTLVGQEITVCSDKDIEYYF